MSKNLKITIIISTIIVFFILLIYVFIMKFVHVTGISMKDTFQDGQYILVTNCKFLNLCSQINKQDIVVSTDTGQDGLMVRRIIALPGDKLMIKEGKIYVNGSELVEPYVNGLTTKLPTNSWMQDGVEYTVPTDNYFVLGDNRNNSRDSRFSDVKYITKENILYKVIGKY